MNILRSLIRIVNAPRVIEQQSALIDKLNQQIEKMIIDINTLDSSVETRLSQKMDQVRHELNEHDHDGEFAHEDHDHGDDLARADHDHGDDFAREDHEHDLDDQIASAVRLKLIASFDEIVSNLEGN
jgi:ABC-type Zn2+ transport system substrate-binding protein/surface adhesin